jgi:hypothetical protein
VKLKGVSRPVFRIANVAFAADRKLPDRAESSRSAAFLHRRRAMPRRAARAPPGRHRSGDIIHTDDAQIATKYAIHSVGAA